MTERRTPTPPTDEDLDELAALGRLSEEEVAALVDLGPEGRVALAELLAAEPDPAPAEEPAGVEAPGEVKGRGIRRATGGTVTDRARRAAELGGSEAPSE